MPDHADKLRGFESSLAAAGARIRLGPIVEAHDDEREGHRRMLSVLRAHPTTAGIYVSTVNSLPVLRAAEEAGRLEGLTVVTTDLFPELVEWIRAGKVAATVYQRPAEPGPHGAAGPLPVLVNAFARLRACAWCRYLVMRSNLDLYPRAAAVDLEAVPDAAPEDLTSARRRGAARIRRAIDEKGAAAARGPDPREALVATTRRAPPCTSGAAA